MAVAIFFFRKKIIQIGQICCDCNQNQEKDPAKVFFVEIIFTDFMYD